MLKLFGDYVLVVVEFESLVGSLGQLDFGQLSFDLLWFGIFTLFRLAPETVVFEPYFALWLEDVGAGRALTSFADFNQRLLRFLDSLLSSSQSLLLYLRR